MSWLREQFRRKGERTAPRPAGRPSDRSHDLIAGWRSSARARLIFWNTVTFAIVLVSLGAAFRVLAERSLLAALDREIRLQGGRFRDAQQVEVVLIDTRADRTKPVAIGGETPLSWPQPEVRLNGARAGIVGHESVSTGNSDTNCSKPAPHEVLRIRAGGQTRGVASGAGPLTGVTVRRGSGAPDQQSWSSDDKLRLGMKLLAAETENGGSSARLRAEYKIINHIATASPDVSGQFLYRTFDLAGRRIASPGSMLPFAVPRPGDDGAPPGSADYRPWDTATFATAARGRTAFGYARVNGARSRLLSIPLMDRDQIVGVLQISAPLAQLDRDLAGLTHSLLLILPIALLVSIIAGIFLTQRALRPVKAMTRAAAAIRPDQLSRRLPVSGGDEFAGLAMTFNGALDRVQSAFLDRERAIAQLRRFTADASHELRTPLTTIKANAGVALAEKEPSEEHVHALRQIDRAADRMTALVQDLLLLARSDAGQLALSFGPVSLPEIVRDAVDSLPPAPRACIAIELEGTDGRIDGDYEHLRRLFINLLQNAVRHTPEDGAITVSITGGDSGIVAAVRDTGCGIAAEHLPYVGQAFYRVDAGRNRKSGGAGLGLAICRSIAEAHRASMKIESRPGKGVAVSLTFRTLSELPARI
ncbi:MAG TPA: HAMP domain-containing sensor histidine kinase [Chthonomonadaceae bacterium]|nr:HAMP domain-containing sensor histidine kinase [Chthonomonadaceae bacterium]